MIRNSFREAIEVIRKSKNIAILPHVSADGDAIGASMALYHTLRALNKDAVIYIEEPVQNRYRNFIRNVSFVIFTDETAVPAHDLCIVVDCGDLARLGSRKRVFDSVPYRISIDHHQSNNNFADLNYVDTAWCATSEAIYYLITEMNIPLNRDIAEALYIGILTDTGGFRHSNTTADTHKIVSELIKTGIDVTSISQQIYDSITIGKLKLIGMLANNTEFYADHRIALCYIRQEFLDSCGATEEDVDGLCDYLRNIETVEVGVLIKNAVNGDLKVNLRSKEYVDVNAVARELGGGGHKRAAGITTSLPYQELKARLVARLEAEISSHGWNNSN